MRSSKVRRVMALACIAVMAALFIVSCSKKKEAATPATPGGATAPVIHQDPANGAVLILYPINSVVTPATFHASAVVIGDTALPGLQRIPLGDLQAMLVTELRPYSGYHIISQAWITPGAPYAGGRLEGVAISAGQLVVLKAVPVIDDRLPFPKTRLEFVKQVPWMNQPGQKINNYLAAVIGNVDRG